MELWHDFLTNDKLLIHKHIHFFPVYERHFSKFRGQSITMLEIGVSHGGSLQMWKRYFGPFAHIVGIDVNAACLKVQGSQISVRIGKQQDQKFLAKLNDEFGPFDIVVDDGSHFMADVKASFRYLYPRMSRNGVYLVEDMHTAYKERFGGGYRAEGSFIEEAKNLIDELNGDSTKGQFEPTDFTRTTHSICFYSSIVCFERGHYISKHGPRIGKFLEGFPITKAEAEAQSKVSQGSEDEETVRGELHIRSDAQRDS